MYFELSLAAAGSHASDEIGTIGMGFSVSGAFLTRRGRRWAIGLAAGLVRQPWRPPHDGRSGWLLMPWAGPMARLYAIDRAFADPYLQLGFIGAQVASSPDTQCDG